VAIDYPVPTCRLVPIGGGPVTSHVTSTWSDAYPARMNRCTFVPAIAGMAIIARLAPAQAGRPELRFVASEPRAYVFADQRFLPPEFGRAEFTLELWITPDTSYPVGETSRGTIGQLTNWSTADPQPYVSASWWLAGNWLLDGFSRPDGFGPGDSRAGSMGLQFYGGGRLRWMFADDDVVVPLGKVFAVEAWPATTTPSLLDGREHYVACVRRWRGEGGAWLELWIDGHEVASTAVPQRVNMRQFWDHPPHPRTPAPLGGWSWGSEVMTAWGMYFTQYESYKGLLRELRFWDRARTPDELQSGSRFQVTGRERALVGWFPFTEGQGTIARDRLDSSRVIILHDRGQPMWLSGPRP
jgi:hypothetical protein